jgi:hypothetical protein
LQLISSFVPASILDKTDRGKAFWDAGIAALNLKHDVCKTLVEVADEVVKVYTQTRSGGVDSSPSPNNNRPLSTASSSTAADGPSSNSPPKPGDVSPTPPTPPSPPLPLMSYSLTDAARMVTITAKEGDPTAQRELALFYLGNSELVERTTLPLSKPREVFKQSVMDKYGGGGSSNLGSGGLGSGASSGGAGGSSGRYHHSSGATGGRGLGQGQPGAGLGMGGSGAGGAGSGAGNDGPGAGDVRSDPALMCLAIHWMRAAEHGGDELARTFLGQNEIAGL